MWSQIIRDCGGWTTISQVLIEIVIIGLFVVSVVKKQDMFRKLLYWNVLLVAISMLVYFTGLNEASIGFISNIKLNPGAEFIEIFPSLYSPLNWANLTLQVSAYILLFNAVAYSFVHLINLKQRKLV